MFAITYYSQASRPFNQQELYKLAAEANTKNERLSVTGFLYFKKGYFLQYIEGDQEAVMALMDIITQDERHTVIHVLSLPDIERRYFKNWFMRYWTHREFYQIQLTDLLEDVLVKMNVRIYGEEMVRNRVIKLVARMAEHHHEFPQRGDTKD